MSGPETEVGLHEATEAKTVDPNMVFKDNAKDWYDVSAKYWEKQEKSVNGMLGGYPECSGFDLLDSRDTIEKYQKQGRLGNGRVADCGCGIGRVSYHVLSDFFTDIDLIDPVASFIDTAREKLGNTVRTRAYPVGIQSWNPEGSFDAYWIQWALMYLTDEDCVSFLQRCKANLSQKGLIFVKDNIANEDKNAAKNEAVFYEDDHGICRTYSHYLDIFARARLTLVESIKQKDWEEGLLPLYTFVLN